MLIDAVCRKFFGAKNGPTHQTKLSFGTKAKKEDVKKEEAMKEEAVKEEEESVEVKEGSDVEKGLDSIDELTGIFAY
jgi:hypothetical protein